MATPSGGTQPPAPPPVDLATFYPHLESLALQNGVSRKRRLVCTEKSKKLHPLFRWVGYMVVLTCVILAGIYAAKHLRRDSSNSVQGGGGALAIRGDPPGGATNDDLGPSTGTPLTSAYALPCQPVRILRVKRSECERRQVCVPCSMYAPVDRNTEVGNTVGGGCTKPRRVQVATAATRSTPKPERFRAQQKRACTMSIAREHQVHNYKITIR